MIEFSELNTNKTKFEDLYFRADESTLRIFLVDAFGKEIEIIFDPIPFCYRYIIEEYGNGNVDIPNGGINIFHTSRISKWLGYRGALIHPEPKEAKFYQIAVGSQAFEVLSVTPPKLVSAIAQQLRTRVKQRVMPQTPAASG